MFCVAISSLWFLWEAGHLCVFSKPLLENGLQFLGVTDQTQPRVLEHSLLHLKVELVQLTTRHVG